MNWDKYHKTFSNFYEMVSREVYSEPDSELHLALMDKIAPLLLERPRGPKRGEKILDIGCGSGALMDKLVSLGLNKEDMTGITLSNKDYKTVQNKGYECYQCDMTFTEFENDSFDFAISRHALEHSPWPYMTLLEYNRIIKMKGRMYIEMPQPGGERVLEHHQNHYSIMSQKMWSSLMIRAGFEFESGTYPVRIKMGDPLKEYDEPYDWYVLVKTIDRASMEPAIF